MAYRIEFSPDVEAHLRALTARRQAIVLDAIEEQLRHEPSAETKNGKPMRPNPLAGWELRRGDLRVYYDVSEEAQLVLVRAVGVKERDMVRIGGGACAAMRTLEISEAASSLAAYVQQTDELPIIVTRDGRPIAALTSLENVDWETISLSTNPRFLDILERSRQRHQVEGGISLEEMRRRLNLPGD